MQEIVGTEAIQSEIMDDARKKAARILEEAEAEAAREVAAIEARAAEVVREIFSANEAKSARFRMETMARFPLERTRMRAAFVDARLREAARGYLESLPEDRVAALSAALLAKGARYLDGKEVLVRRKGLSEERARSASAEALARAASVRYVEDLSLSAPGLAAADGEALASIAATMDLVEERLLDLHRGELARALCAEALDLDIEAPGGRPSR
jgi:V/A-type H+/Na+-transporting ATPase subunit E